MKDNEVRTFAIYDIASGRIVSHYSGSIEFLKQNTPAGHDALEGVFDPHSQLIDHAARAASDWQPQQPSPEHEWDAKTRRWNLTEHAQRVRDRRTIALERIERLERSQHRAIREAALGYDGATARLKAMDEEIQALRADL